MYSSKSTDYQSATITNNGFWPDIAAGEFEEVRAIPTRISHESVRDALLAAVSTVNLRLGTLQQGYQALGYSQACDIPAPHAVMMAQGAADTELQVTTGRNAVEALYIKAVYAQAKADLMPEFSTTGMKDVWPGENAPDARRGLLTESAMAIRTLIGVPRASVGLIG
ncbi:head completion/stabilization protein [Salmonella enterica]|nr:head protein [Salmonella enterica]EAS9235988.1 head protein [Salmonella enterica subsp. enterica]EBY8226113.1 head protein [Salmonella enterica subsp. enterica serovar Adelaide]EIZ8432260.1 head completion/stabilization protein [Salmonella enterica subsp. diarizonae]EAQ9985032.1 head protein [Salmonella enterica]